jgi:predicted porin
MKPIRLAVCLLPLALVAGAAHAQSNVTLYGVLDLGIQYTTNPGLWQERSYITPRVGIRGSEALGGGWNAEFQIEQKLGPDSPEPTGNPAMCDRQCWVGFSGKEVGQVRLGFTKDLFDDWADRIDPFGNNGMIGDFTTPVWRVGVIKSRVNNAIQWHSPNWSGLRVAAQVVMDECVKDGCSTGWAARARYNIGEFEILGAYEETVITSPGTVQPNAWFVGGSYDFKLVKVSAAYNKGDTETTKNGTNEGITVGLEGKLGTGTAKGVYGRLDNSVKGVTVEVYGIGYEYPLSKRTFVYAMVDRETVVNLTGWNAGISHRF